MPHMPHRQELKASMSVFIERTNLRQQTLLKGSN